jgi:competence protein ComGC
VNHPEGVYHLNRRADRGFALVEMLLVPVILGTLTPIIYPNLAKRGLRASDFVRC